MKWYFGSLATLLSAACLSMAGAAPPTVSRDRLPVLGTVGDLPPEKERLIIDLLPAPTMSVGGTTVDMAGLMKILGPRAAAYRESDPQKSARLSVVLRVDRDVRWQDTWTVLQALAEPKIRVYKVFFAAVPEDGGLEGAIAVYQPNRPGAAAASDVPPGFLSLRLAGVEGPTAPLRASLLAALDRSCRWRRSAIRGASVEADPAASTGAVLEAVDSLLRWRVGPVTLRRTSATAAAGGGVVARPEVFLQGESVPGRSSDDPIPQVPARVVGRMAGQTTPPVEPPVGLPGSDPEDEDAIAVGGGAGGYFGGRRSPGRESAREGGAATEAAVDAALDWLARHQSADGSWDSDGFSSRCGAGKCGGPGGPLFDPGVSGLALLAFLGRGETGESPRYGATVRNGLKYLAGIQDPEGCFGRRTSNQFTYNHAIASLAMIEAYALTGSPECRESARNAIKFIVRCRNPGLGWRYTAKPKENDTSVTGWMVMALASARAADLEYDPDAFDGAMAWLARVTEPEYGRAGYTEIGNGPARRTELMSRYPAAKTEAITAMAVMVRLLCGAKESDAFVTKGVDIMSRVLPAFDSRGGGTDFYYWHFGTMAMFQMGGDPWKKWNEAMKTALLGSQCMTEGDERRGSWDPVDPWQLDGGRIYSTAINALTLETYYRYRRIVPTK